MGTMMLSYIQAPRQDGMTSDAPSQCPQECLASPHQLLNFLKPWGVHRSLSTFS